MRKTRAKKRVLLPDPKFNDTLVTRFVNNLMWDGKKSVAFEVFYQALDIVGEKSKDGEKTPLEIWMRVCATKNPWRRNWLQKSWPLPRRKALP